MNFLSYFNINTITNYLYNNIIIPLFGYIIRYVNKAPIKKLIMIINNIPFNVTNIYEIIDNYNNECKIKNTNNSLLLLYANIDNKFIPIDCINDVINTDSLDYDFLDFDSITIDEDIDYEIKKKLQQCISLYPIDIVNESFLCKLSEMLDNTNDVLTMFNIKSLPTEILDKNKIIVEDMLNRCTLYIN